MLATKLKGAYEREAKERMSEGGKKHGEGVAKLPPLELAKSRDQAAAAVGISGRTVQDAERVKRVAPGEAARWKPNTPKC